MNMTVRLEATGGALSHEVVTIAGGNADSGIITVTPSGDGDVTVSVEAPAFRSDFHGIGGTGGGDLTVAAADLGEVGNNPAAGAPSISGTARVGQTLSAATSGITDANGLNDVAYSFQWIHGDGGSIPGGAGPTYEVQKKRQKQDHQGASDIHRRRRLLRVADQRSNWAGRPSN